MEKHSCNFDTIDSRFLHLSTVQIFVRREFACHPFLCLYFMLRLITTVLKFNNDIAYHNCEMKIILLFFSSAMYIDLQEIDFPSMCRFSKKNKKIGIY